jgi:hypothetical protein
MARSAITRRTVLRGMLGGAVVSIGLPTLEAMLNANGTAYAQGAPLPRRLGIFFFGNGIKVDRWTPVDTGPTWTPSVELAPLMAVKDYVSIISGMAIKTGPSQGHHLGAAGILSGAPLVSQPANGAPFRSTFAQKSFDQVAGDSIGLTTKIKTLEVGISQRVNGNEGTTLKYLSHRGPDLPNPPEYDPRLVFDRLFGQGFTPPNGMPVTDVTRALRKSVLDAVSTDVRDLRGIVGAADKRRLDQHLENIQSIEKRLSIDTPVPVACKLPTRPMAFPATGSKEPLEERTQAMSDLIALAFACDLTRVFSMMYSGPTAGTVFWEVNVTAGNHPLTHDEPAPQPGVHSCVVFTMQCLARLITTLKNTPEGAGNVLDNSVILATSDVSDGQAHSVTNYPLVVAGKGGGFLKYPGVHYKSTTAENTSKAVLTVLRAAGVTEDPMTAPAGTPIAKFGGGPGLATTGCAGIEA